MTMVQGNEEVLLGQDWEQWQRAEPGKQSRGVSVARRWLGEWITGGQAGRQAGRQAEEWRVILEAQGNNG